MNWDFTACKCFIKKCKYTFYFYTGEYVNMLLVYSGCRKNAAILYQQRFSYRSSTATSIFIYWVKNGNGFIVKLLRRENNDAPVINKQITIILFASKRNWRQQI